MRAGAWGCTKFAWRLGTVGLDDTGRRSGGSEMTRHELSWPRFNSVGGVTEVTVLAPIKRGRIPGERRTYEDRLRDQIATIQERTNNGLPTALNKVQSIHFGRMIIIRPEQYLASASGLEGVDIPESGFPEAIDVFTETDRSAALGHPKAEPYLPSQLLVLVEYDGDPAVYFRDIAERVAGDFDLVLGNCVGFPGTESFEVFWRWIRRYQLKSDLFLPVYPDVANVRVKALQEFRRRFDEFAAAVEAGRKTGAGNIDQLFDDFLREAEQSGGGYPFGSGLFATDLNGRK